MGNSVGWFNWNNVIKGWPRAMFGWESSENLVCINYRGLLRVSSLVKNFIMLTIYFVR